MKLGAWCGPREIANPRGTAAFAKELGLSRVDIMINDHSGQRERCRFSTRQYDLGKVRELADRVSVLGITANITSWIMPFSSYIREAAEILLPLCAYCTSDELIWDAEECWTQAQGGLDYDEAASLIASEFRDLTALMGMTGIGYASERKLDPLAGICRVGIPQAYATNRAGGLELENVARCIQRWAPKFELDTLHAGLAAYRQDGQDDIPGAGSEVRKGVEEAEEAGCSTVVYWAMRHIRSSREVAEAIRGLARGAVA
jgi:hypothetical protein